MKVSIKDFGVDMQIKNRGIELEVKDPKGKSISWARFIEMAKGQ